MKERRKSLFIISALILMCAGSVYAAERPQITGTYALVAAQDAGRGTTKVTLAIRLANRAHSNLAVQRVGLLEEPFARPAHTTSLQIAAHGTTDITQQFAVPTGAYQHWQRGGRMVLVLTAIGPNGRPQHLPVELKRNSFAGVK